MKIRVYISVALVSAALIGFQLALIQVLSIVQWYHFAYMVIAMAMLGFGAAGSFLSLFRQKLLGHADRLIPLLLTVTGLAMALVIPAAQLSYIRFDAYLLFADYGQIWKLIFTYGLFFIPFFSGALMIGIVFIQQVERIGKIYFANLLGSGIGGILGMLLATWFFPGHVSVFIATLPVIAGLFLLPPGRPYPQLFFSTVVLIVIAFRMSYPAKLKLSEYKDLSKALLLPGAQVISSKPGPHGVVQVVSSPVLRYAPGLSLLAQDAEPVKTATFLNGNWFGAVTGWGAGDSVMILDYTTAALPYIMAKREKVLVLEAGTGMEVVHALSRGAHEITAVEANPVILSALKHRFAGPIEPGADYAPPAFRQLEPRSFLTRDTAGYDLVVLPIIGTFGGSVGMAALQEQFVLTR